MNKQPWDVDPPETGDKSEDITFQAVGAALTQWEWFEGNLSLAFSFLIGVSHGNLAAIRAYGAIETFRGRANMIQRAAEVYFRQQPDDIQEAQLTKILNLALRHLSGKRNEIAHGIVQPWEIMEDGHRVVQNGFVLVPAYYATRKRNLPESREWWVSSITGSDSHPGTEAEPLFTAPREIDLSISASIPTYFYSSIEINKIAALFTAQATQVADVLTFLADRIDPDDHHKYKIRL